MAKARIEKRNLKSPRRESSGTGTPGTEALLEQIGIPPSKKKGEGESRLKKSRL